ncbi:MAG: V-type ATPase subunit [Lachnospiraceae bacterium]|nr:V-type ATPase subunit [Lachnospiraceae bacterium]
MTGNREKYICLSAMLRAREAHMLDRAKAEHMVDAATIEDAAKMLTDCGYEDLSGRTTPEINHILALYKEARINEAASLCPDSETADLFRIKYDYHNAKVLLKSEAMDMEPDRLLSRAGRVSAERIAGYFRDGQLVMLPRPLAHAITQAREILARTGNPQAADFVLDRAYYSEALELVRTLECPWVSGYVRLLIDGANLISAVRAEKLGKDESFLEEVIVDGGSVSKNAITAAGDAASIAELFAAGGPLRDAAAAAAESLDGSITTLEMAVDNAKVEYLKSGSLISYGPETVVAYLAAMENEVTAVRMIFTCRLAGVPGADIKERLRDMYA